MVGRVDLLSPFCARQHDLATVENQQDHLRLLHPENQSREQLGIVLAELLSLYAHTLEFNLEADVVGTDNILNFEIRDFDIFVPDLLDVLRILLRGRL